jgi:autotransporter-associated beta strand protein
MRRILRGIVPILALVAFFAGHRAAAQTNYYWSNDDSGNSNVWSTGAFNWRPSDPNSGFPSPWADGNVAIFGTPAVGGAAAIQVNNNPITAGVSVNSTGFTLYGNGTQTITGNVTLASGVILGLNNIVPTGTQQLNIAGNISGGTRITIQGATGSGSASIIGLSTTNSTVSTNTLINLTGAGVGGYVANASGVTISGTIANSSSGATLIGASSGTLTLTSTAVISGTQGVRFAAGNSGGTGTITVNSLNTYGGATTFNMASTGVVKIGVANALPTGTNVTFGTAASLGGILDLNGFNQQFASLASISGAAGSIRNNGGSASTLTISGSTDASFGLVIANGSSTIALIKNGTNNQTLTGTNTYTGGTTVNAGTLTLGHATDTLSNTGAVTVNGGALAIGANSDAVGAVTLTGGSITGTGGTLTGSSYDVRNGSISANLGGSGALTKSTSGTVTLSGSNTYSGDTTVNAGTLVLGHATNTLSDTGAVTVNGGELSLGSNSDTVGAVTLASGSITGTGTLSGSSYDVRNGAISASLGGSGALTKSTTDTVTLSGSNNTYSGGTTVNGGTLIVTGNNSATGSGSITVASGSTLAGNNPGGALLGTVTVQSGGTLAPGTGGASTGVLKVANDVTFQSGATFQVQINGNAPGTQFSQLSLSAGNASLDGTLSADFTGLTPSQNDKFFIVDNTGAGSLTGTFSNYADGATIATISGQVYTIYYGASADAFGGTNGNDVLIVATPEPASILLLCAAASGLYFLGRRGVGRFSLTNGSR